MVEYRRTPKLWSNERTGAMEAIDLSCGFTVEANIAVSKEIGEECVVRIFARSGCTMCNRYWFRVSTAGAFYWYAGQWQELKNFGPANRENYRLAVREDTCVQIYQGDRVIGIYPASYEIGFAPPTRGNWIEWEVNSPNYLLTSLAYDESGAYAPA